MATTWVFIDKDIIIYQVTYNKVNGATKPSSVPIFTWKCDHWLTAKSDLSETEIARLTDVEFRDVVIEPYANTIVAWDEVELFDINGATLGNFVIVKTPDKRKSLTGQIDNTFMRVRTRDG